MEWFSEIVEFMMRGALGQGSGCTGAMVIDKLCDAVQTGYVNIEEAALSLVKVAETAWLKQAAAWILYGRLPSFGREDFFVQTAEDDIEVCFIVHIIALLLTASSRNIIVSRICYLDSCRRPQRHRCSSLGVL